uniref:Uncharacterized protein n=1 Tax=Trichogramma kaykai TaxID=54128 RepID=A0ABD2XED8_9HYME
MDRGLQGQPPRLCVPIYPMYAAAFCSDKVQRRAAAARTLTYAERKRERKNERLEYVTRSNDTLDESHPRWSQAASSASTCEAALYAQAFGPVIFIHWHAAAAARGIYLSIQLRDRSRPSDLNDENVSRSRKDRWIIHNTLLVNDTMTLHQ